MNKSFLVLLCMLSYFVQARRNPFCFENTKIKTSLIDEVPSFKNNAEEEIKSDWIIRSSNDNEIVLQDVHGNVRHVEKVPEK